MRICLEIVWILAGLAAVSGETARFLGITDANKCMIECTDERLEYCISSLDLNSRGACCGGDEGSEEICTDPERVCSGTESLSSFPKTLSRVICPNDPEVCGDKIVQLEYKNTSIVIEVDLYNDQLCNHIILPPVESNENDTFSISINERPDTYIFFWTIPRKMPESPPTNSSNSTGDSTG